MLDLGVALDTSGGSFAAPARVIGYVADRREHVIDKWRLGCLLTRAGYTLDYEDRFDTRAAVRGQSPPLGTGPPGSPPPPADNPDPPPRGRSRPPVGRSPRKPRG